MYAGWFVSDCFATTSIRESFFTAAPPKGESWDWTSVSVNRRDI